MRDQQRIIYALGLIQRIWLQQPDTRFNQLMHNLQWEYSGANGSVGQGTHYRMHENKEFGHLHFEKQFFVDLYGVEDTDFIAFLENKLK